MKDVCKNPILHKSNFEGCKNENFKSRQCGGYQYKNSHVANFKIDEVFLWIFVGQNGD